MEVRLIKNSILNSITYIISNNSCSEAYLIDCGDIKPILKYIESKHLILIGVFITHGHYDHIYGLEELLIKYPDIKVFGTAEAINALSNSDKNMSYMYDLEHEYEIEQSKINRIELSNDDRVTILGESVLCLFTPGHDVDCMSYLICDNLFTGDAYNPDFEVFTKWSNSNHIEAKINEEFLKNLVVNKKLNIYPGHYKKDD